MRRTVCGAIVVVAVLALAAEAAEERVLPIAPLPDQQAWTAYYYVEGGGTQIERAHGGIPIVDWQGKKALKIHVTHAPGGRWQVGIARKGWGHFQLDDYGRDGTLEFDLWGDLPAGSEIQMGDSNTDGGGPDREVVSRVRLGRYVPEGAGWRRVAVPLGDFLDAEPELDLAHMLKLVLSGPSEQGESTFYVADLGFHTTRPERVYAAVKVDQVGYPPEWAKVAKVTPARPLPDGGEFLVKRADSGEVVHRGRMKEAVLADAPSGDNVYDADFSKLRAPGDYVVEVPGVGASTAFRIATDVYDTLLHDVARFWFFQRCGMELKPEHAGPYAHRACHVHDEAIPDPRGGTRDCRGGWHDAGDMNRYAPWTLRPVWMLLSLYRHYPDKFSDGQFNIPESGNGVPDLLDEIKYEIQWVRKMLIREGQDRGKVYDRIHQRLVRQPEGVDFYDRRHGLREPTDEAACALVANCAYAHLIYKQFPQEREFADACLEDALLAWEYLTSRGKPDDAHFFSAAAMLFEATGRQDAHDVVKRLADSIINTWQGHFVYRTYDCGVITYILSERPEADRALQSRLREYFMGYVNASLDAAKARGYGSPMLSGVVFVWGSNGRLAKIGAHMLMANRVAPNPACVAAARDVLHWLLGRNPVNACMVTGHGQPPLGPIYHSMFGPMGPGLPMPPGYLCGGPSKADAPGLSHYPAKCWRPDHTCFELTEPSLGYQAPFTYLVGALAQLERG